MRLLLAALISLLAALDSGEILAQSATPLDVPLADSTWRVQNTADDMPEAEPFAVTFLADGTLLATTDCPQATGTYTVDEDEGLNIDLLDGSPADCDSGEAITFLDDLEQAASFSVDENGVLTIGLATGGSYVLDPALIGVTWQWVEFQSSNGTLVTPADNDVHQIIFNQDGSADLSTPCVTGRGTFVDSTDGLDVDLSALDAAACPEDSLSSLLLRDLGMATSYVIRDGHLFVALPMDGGIHQFMPVYLPQA